MNAPPLIRLLRRTTQVQMPTAKCAWRQFMRPAQMRLNSSVASSTPEKPTAAAVNAAEKSPADKVRMPRAVQALYLAPLRRECEYGVPSADLQLRSYSKRGLELFSDFALRAAYYLGLPAFGPVPLPRITERWTVPRSHFIYKKSQENFERITMRRLIQIRDGHPETVQVWLAFLQKHAYPGVGMKANMWEFETLGVGKSMDALAESTKELLEPQWAHIGQGKVPTDPAKAKALEELVKEDHAGAVDRIKDEIISMRQKYASGLQPSSAQGPLSDAPCGAIIFSGIQPTGVPHLGNYLGALLRWVQLQDAAAADESTQLYYSVVDLHALTSVQAAGSVSNGDLLRQHRRETLAAMLAIGLDPDRCVLFYQSAVAAHSELMWLLSCTASVGYLSRMTQWKSKLHLKDDASFADEKARAGLKLGLFSYPVLMAADVLVHRATHVPVGEDQSQHLEFAREVASGFNHVHGQPLLVPPTTLLSPARRVMSLQQPTQKMSKSHADARSRILLTDDDETIRNKIMAALTDSTNAVTYDPKTRPGVSNLLELLALVEGDDLYHTVTSSTASIEAVAQALATEMEGKTLGFLKKRVAEAVIRRLVGVRQRFADVLERDDGAYLDRVAEHGAKQARANTAETMDAVRTAIGLC
ncbi:Tryptophan--tRNA ligase, mitochondrial [Sporothrix epigloea]|uniref:tryptophan--tRNA ligase n=1 Tax=Sporothrix epigloea TaxID=1892477 RepID=A0ABP0D3J7_9PEZI